MELNIICFASARDAFGANVIIDGKEGMVISDLKKALLKMNPEAEELLESCRWAINEELVSDEQFVLASSYQIALLPPSSGG